MERENGTALSWNMTTGSRSAENKKEEFDQMQTARSAGGQVIFPDLTTRAAGASQTRHGTAILDGPAHWVEPLLHKLRHGQEEKVVRNLEALLTSSAGVAVKDQDQLCTQVEYLQTHRTHRYRNIARQGGPIGSGSVESFCSQTQNRLREAHLWE
jgi:hypothetical protein